MGQIQQNKPLLSVRGLSISTDGIQIIRDGFLEIRRGQKVGLTGPSGAGKSVTAWTILGLPPQSLSVKGQIRLTPRDGQDFDLLDDTESRLARGSHVAIVPQNPGTSLNPSLRCGHQISADRHKQVITLLQELGIEDPARVYNAYPHQLSGGQLQRVVLAMALINEPELLIADEPATALDTINKAELIQLLNAWTSRTGAALLIITHDLEVLERTCQQIARIENATIGTPVDLSAQGARHAAPIDSNRAGQANVLLEINEINKSYKEVKALRDVSMVLSRGEILGIVGQSGSGKTTLGNCIAGLLDYDKGEIRYEGDKLTYRNNKDLRRKVQMIFQDPYSALYPHRTVGYYVGEPLRLHFSLKADELKKRVIELLAEVDLAPEYYYRMPATLSGGERQRVQIARALGMEPELLICDECVTGLDTEVQLKILQYIRELAKERNMSLLFISHDLGAIKTIAHRVLVMADGLVVEDGELSSLLASPQHIITKQLVKAMDGTSE